jgi:gas vesicle protein
MSKEVSRDKYDRMKNKALQWKRLAMEYKEQINNLELSLKESQYTVPYELSQQIEDLKKNHRQQIEDLKDRHQNNIRELKDKSQEHIAVLVCELSAKNAELQSEKRSTQDTLKYWQNHNGQRRSNNDTFYD